MIYEGHGRREYEAYNNACKKAGIEIEINKTLQQDLIITEAICIIDTTEHDKKINQPYIDEIKALRWLLRGAVDCDFGLDNFPDEYERYKDSLDDDMNYIDMMLTVARCAVEDEEKERK